MNIYRIVLAVLVAATTMLAFAVGCGSESPAAAPAAAPTAPPSEAAQAPAEPDIIDFMDADTARMFQAMNSDWQEMVRNSWGFVVSVAPQDDWKESAADIVSQMYADAKIKGGTSDASVAGVQDIVDPSKGPGPDQSATVSPPFVLGLLPPKYREAYELIPEGSLMREYMASRLGAF